MKIFLAISQPWICEQLCMLLEKRLPDDALECITDGQLLLEQIIEKSPKLVVLDTLLDGRDGISVFHDIRKLPTDKQPEVIVVSSLRARGLLAELALLQPAFYTTLPCDLRLLADRVLYCCRERLRLRLENCTTLEQTITVTLHAFGISARCKGWDYLQEGLLRLLRDPNCRFGLTKRLYPEIAKKYGTTRGSVERAIRSAIASAWAKDGMLWQMILFEKQPSNGEFLARVSDYLRTIAKDLLER